MIIVVTMGLCLFSLSSAMSSNILDQSRELSLLLGLGFKKWILLKLYVYEAMVLVLSSCLVGCSIGTFMGNLILLQQSVFMSTTMFVFIPFEQIKHLPVVALLCAVASTVGSAWSMLRQSIPDI